MDFSRHKEKLPIALLLLVYFVLRCGYLDAVPRWDAATYWGAIAEAVEATHAITSISELPRVILNTYNVFGHSAMGYVGLIVIGQLFDYPNLFALNFVHVLLTMLAVFCSYTIFRWFVPSRKQLPEALLATALFAMDPLFFASSIFINTDFPALVFFMAALAALLYGRYGLFCIACLFMMFSKITGTLFWIGLVGGVGLHSAYVIYLALRARRLPGLGELLPPTNPMSANQALSLPICIYRITCILLPGVLFKLYSIIQQGAMWTMNNGITFNSDGWNCFGFNPRVMSNRAAEIFILNFHWILASIAIVGFFIAYGRFIERKKHVENKPTDPVEVQTSTTREQHSCLAGRRWGLLPVATCFMIFVAFNLSYITYIIPRYVVYGGFFLILLATLALQFAVNSRKLRCIILGLTFSLFFVQTFRTIDPLSILFFGSTSFSEHKILQIDSPGEAQGNGFVYNAEFTLEDKLLNRMQKAIPIKPETIIITWNSDSGYSWFTRGDTFVDATTLKRTIDTRNKFGYNIIDVKSLHSAIAPLEAYYVYMPWLAQFSNEEQELAHVRQFYQVSEAEDVGFQGYSLRLYRLTRHPQQ